MSQDEKGKKYQIVWVFLGDGPSPNPSAVFSKRRLAHEWIVKHKLKGLLSGYPLDIGVYEWAVETGRHKTYGYEESPEFIQNFSGSLPHYHYETDEDYEGFPNPDWDD